MHTYTNFHLHIYIVHVHAHINQDTPAKVEDQPATTRARSPSLDLELSKIEEEDTSSLLAALDDELSHMVCGDRVGVWKILGSLSDLYNCC